MLDVCVNASRLLLPRAARKFSFRLSSTSDALLRASENSAAFCEIILPSRRSLSGEQFFVKSFQIPAVK